MATVAVIDYGMGNLRSVSQALEHVADDSRVIITGDPAVISSADRIVFPGVGALRDCMAELARLRLDEVIRECARRKPLLGICLGMQALFERSEENDGTPGLGLLKGEVRRFPMRAGDALKVPHMGWNNVRHSREHRMWRGIAQDSRFYFVHSYYVAPGQVLDSAATCDYGLEFTCAVARDNVFAVQFHPEKSQQAGLRLLANFLEWDGNR